MICGPLPSTGLAAHLVPLLLLAAGLVGAGALTLLLARRQGRGGSVLLVGALLLGGVTLAGLGTPPPAQAATPGCSSSSPPSSTQPPSALPLQGQPVQPLPPTAHYLEVTQTSTMDGLAPHATPVPITGRLQNHSPERTFVADVHVEISGITRAADAAAGPCSPATTGCSTP